MKRWMPFVVAILLVAVAVLACGCEQETAPKVHVFDEVYAQAQELGYQGSMDELVALFKGDSAYQVACANGYTDSEQEWLASLVGQAGTSPQIGENGNWWVDNLDTGVKASGNDGRGIDRIELTASVGKTDTYTIYYTDGTSQDFVVQNGKDGEKGQAGDSGKGIENITLTQTEGDQDTYTITYTDGSTQTYTVTNGKDGLNGDNGKNGIDGKDGKDAVLTVADLFEAYKLAYEEENGTKYTGTYKDFLETYFAKAYDKMMGLTTVADTLRSSVSIYSGFSVTSNQWVQTENGLEIQPVSKYATMGGSGIIYRLDKENGDAYILTNYHVIYNASADTPLSEDIIVLLYGYENVLEPLADEVYQRKYAIPATYIGGSMQLDVAVLRIEGSDLLRDSIATAVTARNSNDVTVGEPVLAIGNALGHGLAVNSGIVSVDSENYQLTGPDNKTLITYREIRVDAPINEGNSGGGLYDSQGNWIGLVHAKEKSALIDNVAYVIPGNIAAYSADGIIEAYEQNGKEGVYPVKKCLLGIYVRSVASHTLYDSEHNRVVIEEDVEVDQDPQEGAAAYGKLHQGDILRSITIGNNTISITRQFMVIDAMLLAREGETVTITYEREGVTEEVEISLETAVDLDSVQ